MYKTDPGYSDKAGSLFVLDLGPPEKLPDALRGERWSFVQLPLSALREELKTVEEVSSCSSSKTGWKNPGHASSCGWRSAALVD